MIRAWFDRIDKACSRPSPEDSRDEVRDRIRACCCSLPTSRPSRGAAPRAGRAACAKALAGASLAWGSADRIWRLAGDEATDFNHYSKRAILIGVYASTSLVFLDDDSAEMAETRAFLDRRIEDVMRFEKAKARWKGRAPPFSLTRFLGRLRYPRCETFAIDLLATRLVQRLVLPAGKHVCRPVQPEAGFPAAAFPRNPGPADRRPGGRCGGADRLAAARLYRGRLSRRRRRRAGDQRHRIYRDARILGLGDAAAGRFARPSGEGAAGRDARELEAGRRMPAGEVDRMALAWGSGCSPPIR